MQPPSSPAAAQMDWATLIFVPAFGLNIFKRVFHDIIGQPQKLIIALTNAVQAEVRFR